MRTCSNDYILFMLLETFKNFEGFELLDTGDGYRLERWGKIILQRPDPQIIWPKSLIPTEWDKANAVFRVGRGDEKGSWHIIKPIPPHWTAQFQDLEFVLKLSPFKHTGLFAEQAAQWEWMQERFKIEDLKLKDWKPKILNLFGYTGGATMVLAKAGCFVTHVDASKPAIAWAKENHELNKLSKDSVRWILDDAVKFVEREIKRGSLYDGILMDPPAFGHGPTGKTWKFNHDLPRLLENCVKLLSPKAKFLVINGYATNSSALALHHVLEDAIKKQSNDNGTIIGAIEFGELCLSQTNKRLLSTGIFARWSS